MRALPGAERAARGACLCVVRGLERSGQHVLASSPGGLLAMLCLAACRSGIADDTEESVGAAVLRRARERVGWIESNALRQDAQAGTLTDADWKEVVASVHALARTLTDGSLADRCAALSIVASFGYSLRRFVPDARRIELRGQVRDLAPLVRSTLKAAQPEVVAVALSAYAVVAEPSDAAAELGAALQAPQAVVKSAALVELEEMGQLAWPYVGEIVDLVRSRDLETVASRVLRSVKPPAELLRAALHDASDSVRLAAARAAARRDAAGLAADVSVLLDDADANVREAACAALGEMHVSAFAQRLAMRLGDRDAGTRWAAARALGNFREAALELAPSLARALGSDDPGLVSEVLKSLERLGPAAAAALPAVLRLTESRNPTHVTLAARAAIQISPAEHERYALALATKAAPAALRRLAARALGSPGDARSVEVLASALSDADDEVVLGACQSLKWIGSAAAMALPRLRSLASDPERSSDLRFEARQAIVRIDGQASPPFR